MRLDKRSQERVLLGMTILAAALVLGASLIFFFRLDMSSSGASSLSTVSRNLYAEIPERIQVTYYVSKTLSERHPGPQAIEDLLREIEASSRGKIGVSVVDPSTIDNPQAVEALGVAAQQMQVVEKDEQRVALVYTGIVLSYLDRHETIPAIIQPETLEYEFVKAARKLVGNTRLAVSVIVGDPDKTWENDYTVLNQTLVRSGYEVRLAKPGESIAADTSAAIVIGGAKLDEFDLYPVDQYMMRGGKALFLAQGVAVSASYGLFAQPLAKKDLLSMLASYGARIDEQLALDKQCVTLPFQVPGPRGGMALNYIQYPFWIVVKPSGVDRTHPITKRFAGLDLMWPSPLNIQAAAGLTATPLAYTSANGWKQTQRFAIGPQDEPYYYMEADQTKGRYALAAAFEGALGSYFATKAIPAREGATAQWPAEKLASTDKARFVVVSSSDFVNDLLKMTESYRNVDFVMNALEWLGSSADLLELRSRTQRDMRLARIDDPDAKEALIKLTYIVNIGLVPAGIVAFGIIKAMRRKRREKESWAARDEGSKTA